MIRDYLKADTSATSLSVPVTSTVTLSISKAILFSDKRVTHPTGIHSLPLRRFGEAAQFLEEQWGRHIGLTAMPTRLQNYKHPIL
jgi:hypothetical protein